jgi:hypothetical protein
VSLDPKQREEALPGALEAQGSGFRYLGFSADGNAIGWLNQLGALYTWRAPSWEEIAAAEAKEKGEMKQP